MPPLNHFALPVIDKADVPVFIAEKDKIPAVVVLFVVVVQDLIVVVVQDLIVNRCFVIIVDVSTTWPILTIALLVHFYPSWLRGVAPPPLIYSFVAPFLIDGTFVPGIAYFSIDIPRTSF